VTVEFEDDLGSCLRCEKADRPLLLNKKKSKGIPRQAEVALGVQGRLRPRIISTYGTTRVVGLECAILKEDSRSS